MADTDPVNLAPRKVDGAHEGASLIITEAGINNNKKSHAYVYILKAEITNEVPASQAPMEAVALTLQRICAQETKLLHEAVWFCLAVDKAISFPQA